MLKETFKKLKAKIAAILGISILTLGGVQININIDTQKFWKEVEKGKLYVTSFNIKEYKELRPLLVEEMKKKNPSHQAKSLRTQTIKKEKEEKSWEFDKKPEEVLDIKSPEFLIRLNEKLEETIKLEDKK